MLRVDDDEALDSTPSSDPGPRATSSAGSTNTVRWTRSSIVVSFNGMVCPLHYAWPRRLIPIGS